MITAKDALKLTFESVEDKVIELLNICDNAVVKAAKEGLRSTSVKLAWREYGLNTCKFALEELKQQGFDASMENGVECRYIVMCW